MVKNCLRFGFLVFLLFLFAGSVHAQAVIGNSCPASGQNAITANGTPVICTGSPLVWTAVGGGGGLTSVSSLPATCTSGTTQPVQLTASITVGNISYGPSTVFYCDSTNHFSPVSQGSGASPIMGFYLGNACPPSNQAYCYNTPANTQNFLLASYASGVNTVNVPGQVYGVSGSITSNVVTYTASGIPPYIAAGDSVTASAFAVGDSFFNQTCTVTSVTATTIVCPLVHANASSASAGNISDATHGPLTQAMVGRRIEGYASCAAFNLSATNNNSVLTGATATTVSTVNAAGTQLTMSQNAANTVAANGCIYIGTPDDAAAVLVDAAGAIASFCPIIHFQSAGYWFNDPHFFNLPQACIGLPSIYNQQGQGASSSINAQNAGNMLYAAGFTLEGRDVGPTFWFSPHTFPETGVCTHGGSKNACWVITTEGRWSKLMLTGGGNYNAVNIPSTAALIEVDGPASLDNFTCLNMANIAGGVSNPPTNIGLATYFWALLTQVNISGCGGGIAVRTDATGAVNAMRLSVDVPTTIGISVGTLGGNWTSQPFQEADKYNFICYECRVFGGAGLTNGGNFMHLVEVGTGKLAKFYHSSFLPFGVNAGGTKGILLDLLGAGSYADIEDSNLDATCGGNCTAAPWYGIANNTGAGTVVLKNSQIKATAGANTYIDTTGGQLILTGPNVWGTSPGASITAAITGESNDFNQAPITAGKLVLSANWGTSAAVGTLQGANAPIQFTITNGTAATGASPTIAYTFPTPYLVAPFSCTATQTGGTNSVGTFTSGTPSTTGVTFTFSLTPTINLTEIVNVVCITP